jgi:hypothetical protein
MQHTSDAQDLRSFFTREQLYAFSQPPSDAAINQVKKQGSDQDYLSGEYIRLVLNRYIGPGMYDLKVALVGEPMREIIKKDKWENRQKVGTIDNVAVTANVSVEIVIYAPDGSGRTRHYSAVGSHTMYGAAESGAGAIVGNAIKSAETSGLKRAVQPLGRAFGLDLKNKVKDSALPPGIAHFRRLLDEREAARNGQQVLAAPEQPAIEMKPSQIREERTEQTERTERTERSDAAASAGRQQQDAREPAQDQRPQNRAEAGSRQADARQDRQPQRDDAPRADAPKAEAPKAEEQPRREPDWELSMTPSNYGDWVSCIKTMTRRVNAMTSEKELENFVKRNSKLISALPSYPAEGDQQAKDFGLRWKTVMGRRYGDLGLAVPEKYAPPADAKQPA